MDIISTMKNRFNKMLESQLPQLLKEKVIDESTADRIRKFYNENSESSKSTVLTIIGSLAALLIGFGIILLFAYNWNSIPRNVKTIISFLPLIAGQILVYYSWHKKKSSAWTESSSIFLSLAIGSVIALISQIYQIPGDLENFLLIWMVLIFPLIYLTESMGPMIIYLSGILFWSGYSQVANGNAVLYWLLLGALIPKQILLIRKELHSNRTAIVSWLIVINLLIGTGISLEKVLPGLWILIYSLLLVISYMIGQIYYRDSNGGFNDPFRTIGSAGIVILSYIFTFEFFWEDIGLNDIRYDLGFNETIAIIDYIIMALMVILFLYLLFRKTDQLNLKKIIPFLSIFPLALFSFILGSIKDVNIPQSVLFNIYTVFLGAWIIYRGISNKHLFQVNLGMLTVLLIIVTRFFDIDIGFTTKGIIFILLGIVFLLINRYLSRKLPELEVNDE